MFLEVQVFYVISVAYRCDDPPSLSLGFLCSIKSISQHGSSSPESHVPCTYSTLVKIETLHHDT